MNVSKCLVKPCITNSHFSNKKDLYIISLISLNKKIKWLKFLFASPWKAKKRIFCQIKGLTNFLKNSIANSE